jgi:hypothetical protein|tara:strand:+ start:1803 stop:2018 length:216 start_codon:yes stop_codon:yes gene_type:complete
MRARRKKMKKGDLILFCDCTGSSPPEPGVVIDVDMHPLEQDPSCLGLVYVNFPDGEFWVDMEDCELLNGDW